MKIQKYGQEENSEVFVGLKNFGQLVDRLESKGRTDKLVICKLFVNDRRVDFDEEGLLENMNVNQIQTLEVHYEDQRDVFFSAMVSIVNLVNQTTSDCFGLAKRVRAQEDVNTDLAKIIKDCEWVMDSLEEIYRSRGHYIQLYHLPLWKSCELELIEVLKCVVNLVNIKDSDRLADIVQYDLPDALQAWEDTLEKELSSNGRTDLGNY